MITVAAFWSRQPPTQSSNRTNQSLSKKKVKKCNYSGVIQFYCINTKKEKKCGNPERIREQNTTWKNKNANERQGKQVSETNKLKELSMHKNISITENSDDFNSSLLAVTAPIDSIAYIKKNSSYTLRQNKFLQHHWPWMKLWINWWSVSVLRAFTAKHLNLYPIT